MCTYIIDIELQIKEFEGRFSVLLDLTKAELTVRSKSMEILRNKLKMQQMPCSVKRQHYQYVINIISCKYKPFHDLKELFSYLNMYCWNCFEYKLLMNIIERNKCSQALTCRMESYERDILGFRQKTSILEFMNSKQSSTRMNSDLMPPHFRQVTTEHDINPDIYRLVALDDFRVNMTSCLNLPAECAIQIIDLQLKLGRTVVEWRIPYELLEDLTSFFCSEVGQSVLVGHHIGDVVIDGRPPMERQAVRL